MSSALNATVMITRLHPISNGVNVLDISGVTLLSLDDVDAWLFAIDMLPKERTEACRQIVSEGSFNVCNIEHRVEVRCTV